MNQKTRTFWGRTGILAVVLLLVATLLAGCSTNSTAGTKPSVGDIVVDSSYEGGLGAAQLKAVATLLSNTYDAKSFPTTYMLLAASRGYDMTAEGFDDSQASNTEMGPTDPAEAAKTLIAKANEKASDSDKVAQSDYENLNATDVNKLIELFRTTVDVKPETGLQRTIGKFLNWLTGTLGFDYAQATRGGIPLAETDENLMSVFRENLCFAGEILNVDGECGGYNLHLAFASAHLAAEALR